MASKAIKMKDHSGNLIYPCPYYPVGSIYLSINNVNPTNFFGGVWEQIKDTFLLACGDTYSNGATGGEATHTLTTDEMPSHSHKHNPNDNTTIIGTFQSGVAIRGRYASGTSGNYTFNSSSQSHLIWGTTSTDTTGSGNAHNNMPPYLTVYMWQRTA